MRHPDLIAAATILGGTDLDITHIPETHPDAIHLDVLREELLREDLATHGHHQIDGRRYSITRFGGPGYSRRVAVNEKTGISYQVLIPISKKNS